MSSNPQSQFARIERQTEMVPRSRPEPGESPLSRGRSRCQQDDGGARRDQGLLSQRAAHRSALEIGQIACHQDDIEAFVTRPLHRLRAAGGTQHAVPFGLEHALE